MNEKKHNYKNDIKVRTVSLFHFYFDFLNPNYCRYIRMTVKTKMNQFILLMKKNILAKFETFGSRV